MNRLLIATTVAAALICSQIASADDNGHDRQRSHGTTRLTTTTTTSTTTTATPSTSSPHPGRLLASNCFQCHGTEGRSIGGIDSLAGKSASDIYGDVKEMQSKPAGDNIMYVHARGYSDQELRLIADYFSRLPR